MTILEFIQNIGVALGLGCVIGLERQITGHSIGIRTGVLVCMGASLFTTFSFCVPSGDVTRIAAQIVSGVGFLGSGIIFKDGFNIRGINTAATIWCAAGIGVLTGAGLYLHAAAATACLTLANILLRLVSKKMVRLKTADDSGGAFRLNVVCSQERDSEVRKKLVGLLSEKRTYLLALGQKKLQDRSIQFEAKFVYDGKNCTENNERLACELLKDDSVRSVDWDVSD